MIGVFDGVGVLVGVADGVSVGSGGFVAVGVFVGTGVSVAVAVIVGEAGGVAVAVPVVVAVGVVVDVDVPVGVGVIVPVAVCEGVGVTEGVTPGAIVAVLNWVGVAGKVGVAPPGVSVAKTGKVGIMVNVAGTPCTVDSSVGVMACSGKDGIGPGATVYAIMPRQ
jgi:hypothetical protein